MNRRHKTLKTQYVFYLCKINFLIIDERNENVFQSYQDVFNASLSYSTTSRLSIFEIIIFRCGFKIVEQNGKSERRRPTSSGRRVRCYHPTDSHLLELWVLLLNSAEPRGCSTHHRIDGEWARVSIPLLSSWLCFSRENNLKISRLLLLRPIQTSYHSIGPRIISSYLLLGVQKTVLDLLKKIKTSWRLS